MSIAESWEVGAEAEETLFLSPGFRYGRKRPPFIRNKVAVVTGAANSPKGNGKPVGGVSIGGTIVEALAFNGARAVALVDQNEEGIETRIAEVRAGLKCERLPCCVLESFVGDVTDEAFRKFVFDEMGEKHGTVGIFVPAAGMSADKLAVRNDKKTGAPTLYPMDVFRRTQEVNTVAPLYWTQEMIGRISLQRWREGFQKNEDGGLVAWNPAEEEWRGVAVLIGSVVHCGNPGQLAYSVSKGGLLSGACTLHMESRFNGVRVHIVHPSYTATSMVLGLDARVVNPIRNGSQTGDLIDPYTVAKAACYLMETPEAPIELHLWNGWVPRRL